MPRVAVDTRIEHLETDEGDIAEGRYVVLAVADSGHGMSDTVRRRALEPFFTTKDPGKGTGLGLSLVNSFCKAADGTLRILSRPGGGTVFEMLLPCLPEERDRANSPARNAAEASS